MSSFYSIASYNPLLVLLAGLATYAGYLGTGLLILRFMGLKFPVPWRQVVAVLLGIMASSLAVQIAGMASIATQTVLTAIWLAGLAAGVWALILIRPWHSKVRLVLPDKWKFIPVFLMAVALITNLLAAMAPSTKIDELYQYMTLPSRIVNDQALVFYRMPWEGAILPHMLYPVALAPLHAMGLPDAGNVISWALAATMVWFGWRLAGNGHPVSRWTIVALTCLVAGMYPVVWNVTGGSYSMGDLATGAAVVALIMHRKLIAETGPGRFIFLVSFFVMGSVASKVIMLPVGFVILALAAGFIVSEKRPSGAEVIRMCLGSVIPWLVFYLPVLAWTYIHSGSPFGPLFAGMFGIPSAYDPDTIRQVQQVNRLVNLPSFLTIVENLAIYFPVLFWLSAILFATDRVVPFRERMTGMFLVLFQTAILIFVVIFDPRYYNGMIHGILISWVVWQQQSGWPRMARLKKIPAIAALALPGPWVVLQVVYAMQFFQVALGVGDRMDFYRKEVAFISDYMALDRMLPRDAVLVVRGEKEVRLNINYAPRPVCLSMDNPPAGKKIYYFCISQVWQKEEFSTDSLIYRNDSAIITTYRNPFRPAVRGKLAVYEGKNQPHLKHP